MMDALDDYSGISMLMHHRWRDRKATMGVTAWAYSRKVRKVNARDSSTHTDARSICSSLESQVSALYDEPVSRWLLVFGGDLSYLSLAHSCERRMLQGYLLWHGRSAESVTGISQHCLHGRNLCPVSTIPPSLVPILANSQATL